MAIATTALLGGSLAGCSIGQASGELGQDQELLATCPIDTKPATWLGIDVTGSGRDPEIAAANLAIVEENLRRSIVCGGYIEVAAFGGSSAKTVDLFSGKVTLKGATDIARLRRLPEALEDIMGEIGEAYDGVLTGPSPGEGSDIIGQYRLAEEFITQLGEDYSLDLLLLTDGFQNTKSLKISGKKALIQDKIDELVAGLRLPDLTGSTLTVAGLGRVAGDPPSSEVVEGLVSFYDAVCAATGATTCGSVTDYLASR